MNRTNDYVGRKLNEVISELKLVQQSFNIVITTPIAKNIPKLDDDSFYIIRQRVDDNDTCYFVVAARVSGLLWEGGV